MLVVVPVETLAKMLVKMLAEAPYVAPVETLEKVLVETLSV